MRIFVRFLSYIGSNGLDRNESVPDKLQSHKLDDITELKDRLLTHCFVRRFIYKDKKEKTGLVFYEHHFLVETLSYSLEPEQTYGDKDSFQVETIDIKFYEFSTEFGLFSKRDADTWTHEARLTRTNWYATDSNNNKTLKRGKWDILSTEKKTIEDYLKSGIHAVKDRADYVQPALALERVKLFTSTNYKRSYRMQDNNCEHFATACFGMVNGRGWSFQTMKAAKRGTYAKIDTKSRNLSQSSERTVTSVCTEMTIVSDISENAIMRKLSARRVTAWM